MDRKSLPRVAVLGGARTPFVKAGTVFRELSARELSRHAVDGLCERLRLVPDKVELLAWGVVTVDVGRPHLAREVVFASQLPAATRALTLTDNCVTGLSAIANVVDALVLGRIEIGIAGGVDSTSNPVLRFGPRASRIFLDAAAARSAGERLRLFARLRPRDFLPRPPAVTEPSTGLSMGEHCELMVKQWGISRREQDELALASHQKAHRATVAGFLPAEIHPLAGIDRDLLVRADTSLDKLAALPPVFDRTATGTLTAGNSSPLTDGAAAVLLATEDRALRERREILAFVKDFEFASLDPADGLLMGPALAVPRLLRRAKLELEQIDLVEMHEAFAGQVAANLKAWEWGWKEPAIGRVRRERLNVNGSSIAVGHPFAATGARIALSLAMEMKRRDARYGLASVCGAGATAGALLLERA